MSNAVGQTVTVQRVGLATLAKQINAAHKACEESVRGSFARAAEAGDLLVKVKEQLSHGEWLPWLKKNFDGSHKTASGYMIVASRLPELEANLKRDSNLSIRAAIKMLSAPAKAERKDKRRAAKEAAKEAVPDDLPPTDERFQLIHADIAEVNGEVPTGGVDWIITDPPYPEEYLPVYDSLSEFAARVLKPGGSALVMVGQSYLPQVIERLSKHLKYHWTLAYLTPGGQAVQLWDRKVQTFWKPLLWFVNGDYKSKDWIGDVCKSEVNDNDKTHHHWGQSESGMADVVSRFTYPGQVICDPFVGGGTTGVVSVSMNRRFIGIDKSEDAIETTQRRLEKVGKCNGL